MSDYLYVIFKGLYPVYFLLFIWGIRHRLHRQSWNVFDCFLCLFFLIFELLAAFQVPAFYGIWTTSKRYLWLGLPLCLPLAAEGVLALTELPAVQRHRKLLPVIFAIAVIGFNMYNVYKPVLHQRFSAKKAAASQITRAAAAWIRKDWGARRTEPVLLFKCDLYQSGKRPLVQSDLGRVGWLCGGQNYVDFMASRNVQPDYLVTLAPVKKDGCTLVKVIEPAYIYKNNSLQP